MLHSARRASCTETSSQVQAKSRRLRKHQVLTFGQRVDAVLGRELAEAEGAMLLLLLQVLMMMMMMMVRVMILRWRRGLPHATHQAEGTADASPASTAAGGGARRHPAALKHPEEPECNVGLSHAPIPSREERGLRSLPALPAVHLSLSLFLSTSLARDLVSRSRKSICARARRGWCSRHVLVRLNSRFNSRGEDRARRCGFARRRDVDARRFGVYWFLSADLTFVVSGPTLRNLIPMCDATQTDARSFFLSSFLSASSGSWFTSAMSDEGYDGSGRVITFESRIISKQLRSRALRERFYVCA